jgi:CheY-like chemotaxis protein
MPQDIQGFRVLVVDDDNDIRSTLADALTDNGILVTLAADGAEALAAQPQHHDLILLDLQMPVMTGWELLRRLRSDGITTPVVLMSANGTVEDEAATCGADGMLAKPFSLDVLDALIARFAAHDGHAGRLSVG